MTVYIALGSNLGDRRAFMERALREMNARERVAVVRMSTIRETDPVGPSGQGPYLNAVAEVKTTLPPGDLLEQLLEIERMLGRDRGAEERWGPRVIDLDILFYGDLVMDRPFLHIPHARLQDRLFVLEPLAELAPELCHPGLGKTVSELLEALRGGAPRS